MPRIWMVGFAMMCALLLAWEPKVEAVQTVTFGAETNALTLEMPDAWDVIEDWLVFDDEFDVTIGIESADIDGDVIMNFKCEDYERPFSCEEYLRVMVDEINQMQPSQGNPEYFRAVAIGEDRVDAIVVQVIARDGSVLLEERMPVERLSVNGIEMAGVDCSVLTSLEALAVGRLPVTAWQYVFANETYGYAMLCVAEKERYKEHANEFFDVMASLRFGTE